MADPGSWQMIKQGAEARIYTTDFFGKDAIVKERFCKSYRVPALDEKLTQRRMSQEVRSIARCRRYGIRAPAVYHMDSVRKIIVMERITDGLLLKDYVRQMDPEDNDTFTRLMHCVGQLLASMHDADVIHGDLTTSNMVYNVEREELTLIDFGLSYVSALHEDKGVDLYVLERAFLSTHPRTEVHFQKLLDSYAKNSKSSKAILSKLDEVRMRGRKRTMVG